LQNRSNGGSGEIAASNLTEALDVVRMCFARDVNKSIADKRERGASLTERIRAGSIKKTQLSADKRATSAASGLTPERKRSLTGINNAKVKKKFFFFVCF
jgi:hypothetical protein